MNSAAARIANVAEPSRSRFLGGSGLLYDYLRWRTRAVIAQQVRTDTLRDAGFRCLHGVARQVSVPRQRFGDAHAALTFLRATAGRSKG